MSRRLAWDRRARDELAAIARRDPRAAGRIRDAVARYADQERGDVLKLTGREAIYRLRVGDWRVLFTIEDDDGVLLILRVLNRRDAYR
ncbi:MAG: type II toxin-antitoxin system RelE/ParE family toxin [Chloroflexota bacterium]|nr:type II toxin-antitoxin system RelE/ParE family toxin [Chloroflexota bacterium]